MMEFTAYDRSSVLAGWVHLGIGAFHRAHQAVYVDGILADDPAWGIRAVSLRRADMRNALRRQGGLYTLAVNGADGMDTRVIGSVLDVLYAREDDVLGALCRPAVRIVSLTVTEKGYCIDPVSATLDMNHPDIVADLSGDTTSAMGWIVAGLAARKASGAGPFTVLSCDNLPSNGTLMRQSVLQLAGQLEDGLADWIAQYVSFPNSMVDRIAPALTQADVMEVNRITGFDDAVPVMTEPFSQWVVEDDFCAGRPDLEAVGVQFVRDVAPFEKMKLRMLNGCHSTLAYMACQMGLETVAQAMAHDGLAGVLRKLMHEEIIPLLDMPGTDLHSYADRLMQRFANRALHHKVAQIAMDGTQKIPLRLLPSIREARAAAMPHERLTAGVAAWITHVTHVTQGGQGALQYPRQDRLQDPLAHQLEGLSVDGVLDMEEIFGDLCTDAGFRSKITDQVREISELGMDSFVARLA